MYSLCNLEFAGTCWCYLFDAICHLSKYKEINKFPFFDNDKHTLRTQQINMHLLPFVMLLLQLLNFVKLQNIEILTNSSFFDYEKFICLHWIGTHNSYAVASPFWHQAKIKHFEGIHHTKRSKFDTHGHWLSPIQTLKKSRTKLAITKR